MILKAAQWSFLLLIFTLPFPRPFNFDVGGTSIPYTDVIFLFAFAAVILAILSKRLQPRSDRIFILIALYAFSLAIAVFQPNARPIKLAGEFYLFALCWTAFILCSDREFFKKTVFVWLIATAIAAFIALIGVGLFYAGYKTQDANYFLSHGGSLPAGDYPRVQGLFANPNMFCNYLNVGVCFLLIAWETSRIPRWAFWLAATAILLAAAFTLSPGLGGIALSLGLLLGTRRMELGLGLGRIAVAGGISVAVLMLLLVLVSPETGNTTTAAQVPFSERRIEPSVRVLVWKDVLERTAPNILFGRGTGATTASLAYKQLSGERQVLADAHNMYLNVFGQAGLIGLAAFLLLVIALSRRLKLKTQDPFLLATSCAFVGAFLYQGLSGSFEDARHLWILIGLLIAASSNEISHRGSDALPASTGP